ncbi:MAG: hypothetical protein U0704_11795 [Candidatus Eisenbacteria bacterium]
MLEVAARRHVPVRGDHGRVGRAEHVLELRGRPDVETAFLALAVGVLGAEARALGRRQVARHVRDDPARDFGPARVARREPAVGVRVEDQRLVVEHLLEVRHEPFAVGRVAMEPAPTWS